MGGEEHRRSNPVYGGDAALPLAVKGAKLGPLISNGGQRRYLTQMSHPKNLTAAKAAIWGENSGGGGDKTE
jgi:hypothetical protein